MRKLTILFITFFLVLPILADQNYYKNFLSTAINVNNNTTAVDGTAFTSQPVSIGNQAAIGSISVWFTPAAGAAVPIDFELAVSYDNGTTWTTGTGADAYVRIRVNTNVTAVGGVVRASERIGFDGVTHVKLYRVVVGSGAGNCTLINARLSIGR